VADKGIIENNGDSEGNKPLSLIKAGQSVRLIKVDGGNGLKQRMVAMGLLPGACFEVLKNKGDGPVVLSVKGARLIIGRGMSDKILVSG
jgi:ferrous iron transport protein A